MYFLTILASWSDRTEVPRLVRMYLALWLMRRWRLPATPARTLPVAVTLKRFLAPDLVFIFGILRSSLFAKSDLSSCGRREPGGFIEISRSKTATACLSAGRPGLGVCLIGAGGADGKGRGDGQQALPRPKRKRAPEPRSPNPSRPDGARSAGRQHHNHLAPFRARAGLDLGELVHLVPDLVEQFEPKLLVRHLAAAEPHGDLDLVALAQELLDRAHLHVVVVIIDIGPELDLLDLDDLLLLARLRRLLLGGIF